MVPNPLLPSVYDLLWTGGVVVVGLVVIALWVVALVQIARASLSDTARAVWVLVVIVAPVLGAIAWFAVGRSVRKPMRS